ncbi:ATP-binding protein [Spirillospora sp. NPDC048911]|uniref:ATP-binding protein n=1 Tax=Spirillospora sp. NPDC048911 TaxID=3364527 RepID=UPI003721BE64
MNACTRPHYALALKPTAASVPLSRELVKALLEECALPELIDDATLIAAELVTNAIRSEQDVVLLVFLDDERRLIIQVWDHGDGTPTVGTPTDLDESGRGLLLVQSLADEWGYTPDVLGGKIVWASLSNKQPTDD